MKLRRAIGLLFLASLLPGGVAASRVEYLAQNQLICDEYNEFCLAGTLSFQPNPRLIRLRGRVRRAPGPGLLRITLIGYTRQGFRRLSPLEVRVRGNVTEIINHKMVPDFPEAESWSVQFVEFIADPDGAAPRR